MHRLRNKGIKQLQEILVAWMTCSMVRNPTLPALARLCPVPGAQPETTVTFMGLSGKSSQLSIREGCSVEPSATEHCVCYPWGITQLKKSFLKLEDSGRISLQCISPAKELNFNAGDFSCYQNRMNLNNTGTSRRACLRSPTCIPPR